MLVLVYRLHFSFDARPCAQLWRAGQRRRPDGQHTEQAGGLPRGGRTQRCPRSAAARRIVTSQPQAAGAPCDRPPNEQRPAELHQRGIMRRKSGAIWPDLSEYWYHENNALATFYKTFVRLVGGLGAAPIIEPPALGAAPRRGAETSATRPREGGLSPPSERSPAQRAAAAMPTVPLVVR